MGETALRPILYLDDDLLDLKVMRSCHELSNCESPLVTMQDVDAFLAHMRSVVAGAAPRPELLLIDIRMPAMSGFEVVARLQRLLDGEVPPVVFFTTSARAEDERTAAALGGRLVSKPAHVDGYVSLLNHGFFDGP